MDKKVAFTDVIRIFCIPVWKTVARHEIVYSTYVILLWQADLPAPTSRKLIAELSKGWNINSKVRMLSFSLISSAQELTKLWTLRAFKVWKLGAFKTVEI